MSCKICGSYMHEVTTAGCPASSMMTSDEVLQIAYDLNAGMVSEIGRLRAALVKEREHLAEMERRLEDYESIMNGPVGNAPDVVAEYFINNECLWYPGTRLCAGFKSRLVSVIKRARLDGAATYHEQKAKQALEDEGKP